MTAARQITGRTVLIGALAFFAVVIAANAALVFFALASWPGLATERAYAEGLAYNRTLAAARAQAERGWRSRVAFRGGTAEGRIEVRVATASAEPVTGLAARVTLRRPVGAGDDLTVTLRETAPGVYAGAAAPRLPGRWYALVAADRDGVPVYRLRHQIVVRP